MSGLVEGSGRRGDSAVVPTIASLLAAHRDRTGDSYDDMERRVGGVVKAARFHQLVRETPSAFPQPRTVEALAGLLQMPVASVVLSIASSLGIPVQDSASKLASSLPPGTDNLTDDDRDAILAVTRALVAARRSAGGQVVDLARREPDLEILAARHGESEGRRIADEQDQAAENDNIDNGGLP